MNEVYWDWDDEGDRLCLILIPCVHYISKPKLFGLIYATRWIDDTFLKENKEEERREGELQLQSLNLKPPQDRGRRSLILIFQKRKMARIIYGANFEACGKSMFKTKWNISIIVHLIERNRNTLSLCRTNILLFALCPYLQTAMQIRIRNERAHIHTTWRWSTFA